MSDNPDLISRLRTYYMNLEDIQLSAEDLRILARWEEAFTFLRDTKSHVKTVDLLARRYPNLTRRTLYSDVRGALALFGDVIQISKQAMRAMLNEYGLDLLNRCKIANDRQNEIKTLNFLMKNNLTDTDVPDEFDPNQLLSKPPEITMPEEVYGMLLGLANQGSVNLMAIREKQKVLKSLNVDNIQSASADFSDSSTA